MKKYAITLTIEVILTALLAWSMEIMDQTALVNIFHILCDSFFVVGMTTTGIGALVFVSNEGVFDGLIFGMRSFINIFKKNAPRSTETYYDFRMSRAEHKFGFVFLLICGLIFLAIAIVMYLLYCQYSV